MNVEAMGTATGLFREQRREALRNAKEVTGLDYIQVEQLDHMDQPYLWLLHLHFVPKLTQGIDVQTIPPTISNRNIRMTLENAPARLEILTVKYPVRPEFLGILTLEIDAEGEAISHQTLRAVTFSLSIIDMPALDPFFSQAPFRLPPRETTDLDQTIAVHAPAKPVKNPPINYLAKDYVGFRTLLVNQLALLMPGWGPHSEADMWVMLSEVGAYKADHTSYFQDAVGTEAYLETARKRISITRLARLTDYRLYEGQNARVWVQIHLADGSGRETLLKGTQILTRNATTGVVIGNNHKSTFEKAIQSGALVFETLYDTTLLEKQNQFKIYFWGAIPFTIPKGATQVALEGHFKNDLAPGDPLLFIEVRQPQSGSLKDANPANRQVIRIREIELTNDPLGGQFNGSAEAGPVPITIVRWDQGDALVFDFWVTNMVDGTFIDDISIVSGNLVLADHGQTIRDETLTPETVPENRTYQPVLSQPNLTFAQPFDPELAANEPASRATSQIPAEVVPDIFLIEQNQVLDVWHNQPDLLSSNAYAKVFTTELDDLRLVHLRFGTGHLGKRPVPGISLKATYRVGNGSAGNVGSNAISQIVTDSTKIVDVTNPLAAEGGREMETNDLGKMYASQAFRVQERAVTALDFSQIALRYPDVSAAAAAFSWTGSWNTVFLAIRRLGNKPIDDEFKLGLQYFFESYTIAGLGLEIIGPIMAPLEIKIEIFLSPEYAANEVRSQLDQIFGTGYLANGQPAFFNLERLGLGRTIAFSSIADWALQVPGVVGLNPLVFRRRSLDDGGNHSEIAIAPLEIARVDNNPALPQNGEITFMMSDL